jgi:hypothetical protein
MTVKIQSSQAENRKAQMEMQNKEIMARASKDRRHQTICLRYQLERIGLSGD